MPTTRLSQSLKLVVTVLPFISGYTFYFLAVYHSLPIWILYVPCVDFMQSAARYVGISLSPDPTHLLLL